MSSEAILPQATPTAAMIRTLGLIAALCGVIIVTAYRGTYTAVQENKRIAVERAVFKVIPAATAIVEFVAMPNGEIAKVGAGNTAAAGTAAASGASGNAIKFFAGYDADGKLAGIAAEGAAKGYSDTVRVLFAWDPASATITGFGVVSSRETPGIGDKISTDKGFLASFPLEARLADDRMVLAREITTVKHGSRTNPWEIDAIAGATITSRAVGKAINAAAQDLLPRLAPHIDKLKEKP